MLYINRAGQYAFFFFTDSDNTPVTGLTVSVIANYGATQSAGSGTVVEMGNGWYRYNITQAETNAEIVGYSASAAGATAAPVICYPSNLSESWSSNLTQIDGQATSGNNATLNLKQLNVVNNAGSAIVANATGGNGTGFSVGGNGTGSAMSLTGGANGLLVSGATRSIYVNHSGTGAGVFVVSTTPGMNAFEIAHNPSSSGSGSALRIVSGSNSTGTTLSFSHSGSANTAVQIVGGGTGAGVSVSGGINGVGALISGGATSGNAITISANGSGVGIDVVAGTINPGVRVTAGATGNAVELVGGSTSGNGLNISTTNGHGINIGALGTGKYSLNIPDWGGVLTPDIWENTYDDTQAILMAISGAVITTNNPVTTEQLNLVQGDSYTILSGRPLRWVVENYTGPDPAGGTLTFGIVSGSSYGAPTASSPILGPITGTAVVTDGDLIMTIELTSTQTGTLTPGYPSTCPPDQYQLLLTTSDSQKITEIMGPVGVTKKII